MRVSKYHCPICGRRFATVEGLVIHLANYHELPDEAVAEVVKRTLAQ